MNINFVQLLGSSTYNVIVNDVSGGALAPKEDGYWDWYPELRPGYIPAWVLHAIATKLDSLNAEWDKIVDSECGY